MENALSDKETNKTTPKHKHSHSLLTAGPQIFHLSGHAADSRTVPKFREDSICLVLSACPPHMPPSVTWDPALAIPGL
jgi:hypothetical protein